MSVLRLTLVRHGETEWTEAGLLHGRLDSPLSAAGRRHSAQTARALEGRSFQALYSSPRGRALETAELLGAALGLRPQPLAGLAEVDFGLLEGRPLRSVDPAGRGSRLQQLAMGLTIALTGEPAWRVARRVQAALDQIVGAHRGQQVLVVTHWGVMSMIAALTLDGAARNWRRRGPWAACGISELEAAASGGDGRPRWRALRLDDRGHLDKEERS